jgi:hypothetical protein
MKKPLLVLLALVFVQFSAAQMESSSSKRISVGAKVGVPNILSLNGEVVLPILDNHFAPFIDYGAFDIEDGDTEVGLNYTEFGLNYYFGSKGKGFYIGAGIAELSTDVTFNDLEFDDGTIGSGSVGLDIGTTNLKLGLKTGGVLYFRIEAGYGLGSPPKTIEVIGTANGVTETFIEPIPEIPGVNESGLLIGNIGFGFSF